MAFHVQIDPGDQRVLFYFEDLQEEREGHLSFPDVASTPGWDDSTQILVGQQWDGAMFIPLGPLPTHRRQMTGAEFNRLFLPAEYRKIKLLRQQDTDNALAIDQLWDIAELQNSVNMETPEYQAAAVVLVEENCVTQERMDEISLGWPLERAVL